MEAQRRILVVEDSSDDLFFLERALRRCSCELPVDVTTDGMQAVSYLGTAVAKGKETAIPRIIFLDLKLPRMNGFDVLKWMQSRPAFASALKVVVTGSDEERDVAQAFDLGADAYLVKPLEQSDMQAILDAAGSSSALPGLRRAVPTAA